MEARRLATNWPLPRIVTAHEVTKATFFAAWLASEYTVVNGRGRRGRRSIRKTCGTHVAYTGKARRTARAATTATYCGTAVTGTVLADWTTAVTCISVA
jgi:hypothetical protein